MLLKTNFSNLTLISIFIAIICSLLTIGCQQSSTEFEYQFGGDETLKKVMLNIDMTCQREQLFHIEPIVTTLNKKPVVDLVALVGIPFSHKERDSEEYVLDSIQFRLANDDINKNHYNLHIHNWSLITIDDQSIMDTLQVHAGSDSFINLKNTLVFEGKKPKKGYMNDIKFIISPRQDNDSFELYNLPKAFSAPRICTWTLL